MAAMTPPNKGDLIALVQAQLPEYALAVCRDPAATVPLGPELLAAFDGSLDDDGARRLAEALPVAAGTVVGGGGGGADSQSQQRLASAWEELAAAWEGHGLVPFRPEHLSSTTVQYCLQSGSSAAQWAQAAAAAAADRGGIGGGQPFAVQAVELEDGIQAGFGYLSAMSRVAVHYTDDAAAAAAGLPSSVVIKLSPTTANFGTRLRSRMSRFMSNEYNYFRTLQGQPGIALPRTFFLAYDDFTDRCPVAVCFSGCDRAVLVMMEGLRAGSATVPGLSW
eukprot:COSAG01_NODE_5211_length_4407_cov_21.587279_2_plen_278_part_00